MYHQTQMQPEPFLVQGFNEFDAQINYHHMLSAAENKPIVSKLDYDQTTSSDEKDLITPSVPSMDYGLTSSDSVGSVDSGSSVSNASSTDSDQEDLVAQELPELEHDSLLILLDWDDTLFPTTLLNEILQSRNKNSLALVRDEDIQSLTQLGQLTLSLLTELIARYGADQIHIVTNSLEGWIKESLCYASCISPVYKELDALLAQHSITMVSAQSTHRAVEGSTPTQWKQWCFDEIIAANPKAHLLTIGDQWTDHVSVSHSVESMKDFHPVHHVIKLKASPSVQDMLNEIVYIQTCFSTIFDVISWRKSPYFANPHSVQPVYIDYASLEQQQAEQQLKLQQQQQQMQSANNLYYANCYPMQVSQ